jgi:hypothetical protein
MEKIDPSPDGSTSERSNIEGKMVDTKLERTGDSEPELATFDLKATKRLLRKMDIRLVPFLALLYL